MLPLQAPPRTLAILRLSAIGDTCHVVPVIRTLQHAWPETRLTWFIGRTEAKLMSLLPGVEFITVDKRAGLASMARDLRARLRDRHFDVLLHMHVSFRASLVSTLVPATLKLGFDRARARELQWLFTNARIEPRVREHVLDSFTGFTRALGIEARVLRWDLPLPPDALAYAQALIPDADARDASRHGRVLVISPCSSEPRRNWSAARYAALAAHAIRAHGMRVVLVGGPTGLEREVAAAIERDCPEPLVNQVGKDTLPQLLALLARAAALVSPDSGPAHMATMVGTPVLGLYAVSNPARSGPYLSRQWCVDRFAEAAARYRNSTPERMPWSARIELPGVMDLIEVDAVVERLDALMRRPLPDTMPA